MTLKYKSGNTKYPEEALLSARFFFSQANSTILTIGLKSEWNDEFSMNQRIINNLKF